MSNSYEQLRQQLQPLGLRLRYRDTLLLASRTLWSGTIGFALVLLAGRFIPIHNLWLLAVIPLILWALAMIGYLLARQLSLQQVARRIDSQMELRERLSTAIELHDQANHDLLSQLQQEEAATVAQRLHPGQIPFEVDRQRLRVSMVPLALGLALLWLPNPQNAILAEQRQVQQTLAQVADQLEQLAEQIAQNQELTAEERALLEQQLAELQERLRQNAGNREEALADLSATEARLQQQLDPQTDARQAALEQMARNLESLSGRRPTARPDLNQARQQLERLAQELDTMNEAERETLAEQLAQQAGQLAASDPRTAQSLSQAAQALRNGDIEQAAAQLQQAAQDVRNAQSQLADQRVVQESLAQIQEGRQHVARSGQQSQSGQSGQQGQSGQSGHQGQSGQSGQTGSGGSQADHLGQGQSDTSAQVDPNRPGRNGSGAGRERSDLVYQPYNPSTQTGERDFIQGQQGEGGQTQQREGEQALPGAVNPSLVPYEQIFPEYARSASEALDRGYIPPHLKEYVRDYFSQLEPGNAP